MSVGSETSMLNSIPSSERFALLSFMSSIQPEAKSEKIMVNVKNFDLVECIVRLVLKSTDKVMKLFLSINDF